MLRERNVRAIMAKKKKVGRRNLKMEHTHTQKKTNVGKCDQMGVRNKGESGSWRRKDREQRNWEPSAPPGHSSPLLGSVARDA